MSTNLSQLIKWRREFHQYPETGWAEFWTTCKIADYLESMGFEKILMGKQIINPEFVRGRHLPTVKQSIEKALTNGANPKWLDKMQEFTGCVAVFDSGRAGAGQRF